MLINCRSVAAFLTAALAIASPARAQPVSVGDTHACAIADDLSLQCWGSNFSSEIGYPSANIGASFEPAYVPGLILDNIVSVSAGGDHTCALTDLGEVVCFGGNASGQLGDGSQVPESDVPVTVQGLANGALGVSAGGAHTCAINAAGGVLCWGSNETGALGNGNNGDSSTPVQVVGLTSGVVEVAAGLGHSCARTDTGNVFCWGNGFNGQLGNGQTTSTNAPVPVTGLGAPALAIGAGANHSCALLQGGAVRCWGDNFNGQLGDGNSGFSANQNPTPVAVSGLSSGVIAIGAGAQHSCAVLTTGALKCWGDNEFGQRGDGTTTQTPKTPVDVVGLNAGVFAVDGGEESTCAYLDDGNVRCFGFNAFGQLGDGGPILERERPVPVSGLFSGVTQISAGRDHSCARLDTGELRCWGFNAIGQLGIGDFSLVEPLPARVTGFASGAASVSAGETHTCATTGTGAAQCWGDNVQGQLGDASNTDSTTPVAVSGLSNGVAPIAAGSQMSCATSAAGGSLCWGVGADGQLGGGPSSRAGSNTPLSIFNTPAYTALALGTRHACAIDGGGAVQCWGDNTLGQLGTGATPANSDVPLGVSGITSGAIAISSHANHSCVVIGGTGQVRCWGDNTFGQLGNGGTTSSPTPVDAAITGASKVAVGADFTCALIQASGSVRCVGGNLFGQLGNGSFGPSATPSLSPTTVLGLSNVIDIDAGEGHVCAIVSGGAAFCWGHTIFGQLGNGDTFLSPVPTTAFLISGEGIENVGSFDGDADSDSNDLGGFSVAQTDDLVVMGAPGAGLGASAGTGEVYVFQRVRSKADVVKTAMALPPGKRDKYRASYRRKDLVPVAVLSAPGGQPGDKFGQAVAISGNGNTIVVGAPDAGVGDVGQAFVFTQPATGWSGFPAPSSTLNPSNSAQVQWDGFGSSVAIGNDGTIIVGAPDSDVTGPVAPGKRGKGPIGDKWGAAAAFNGNGSPVNQTGEITPPGQPQNDANFGASVALGGGSLLIGAPNMDVGTSIDAGMAVAYNASSGNVSNPQPLTAQGGSGGDKWGSSVAVGGNGTAVVGAPGDDTPQGADSGSATVLVPSGGTLQASATLLPMTGAGQGAGAAVATNGDTILLGAPNATDNNQNAEGMVYSYDVPPFSGTPGLIPSQLPQDQIQNPAGAAGDQFGTSLAVSQSGFLVGVPFDDQTVSDADQGRAEAFGFDRILRASFEGN
jgi:alpha-tubulin suppressor-like RCC1 family protein